MLPLFHTIYSDLYFNLSLSFSLKRPQLHIYMNTPADPRDIQTEVRKDSIIEEYRNRKAPSNKDLHRKIR